MKKKTRLKGIRPLAKETPQPDSQELKVGQRIKYSRFVLCGEDRHREERVEKGTVVNVYGNIFRVKLDSHNYFECFPKSALNWTVGERISPL